MISILFSWLPFILIPNLPLIKRELWLQEPIQVAGQTLPVTCAILTFRLVYEGHLVDWRQKKWASLYPVILQEELQEPRRLKFTLPSGIFTLVICMLVRYLSCECWHQRWVQGMLGKPAVGTTSTRLKINNMTPGRLTHPCVKISGFVKGTVCLATKIYFFQAFTVYFSLIIWPKCPDSKKLQLIFILTKIKPSSLFHS